MERSTNMLSLFHYLIHEPNNQWIEMEDAGWSEASKYSKLFKD